MTQINKKTGAGARTDERAARLHQEALNCLRIAVTEEKETLSADLIDEALKLAKRSRELGGRVDLAFFR